MRRKAYTPARRHSCQSLDVSLWETGCRCSWTETRQLSEPRRLHLFQSQLGVEMLSQHLQKQALLSVNCTVCARLCLAGNERLRSTPEGEVLPGLQATAVQRLCGGSAPTCEGMSVSQFQRRLGAMLVPCCSTQLEHRRSRGRGAQGRHRQSGVPAMSWCRVQELQEHIAAGSSC